MKYDWDTRKNEINIAKHGIDFADASRVFQMSVLTDMDDRFNYGEDRWVGLGLLDGRVINIVYTEPVYYETQRLQDEIRHLREDAERRDKDAARARENLILRLENQLLRAERGLPPPKASDPEE